MSHHSLTKGVRGAASGGGFGGAVPNDYVLVSGASTDGWLPLFDALSDADMQANALSSGAKIDLGPHVDAYKSAGFEVKPIAKALAEFDKIMRPQIVSSAEYEAAIKAVAGSLLALALSLQGSMLFPMENHGIKSNLWVFMSVLREMRCAVKGGARAWRALAERIFIVVERRSPDQPSASLPKGPVRLIFCDDCVYSGWHMGDIVGQFCDMEFNGKKTEHPVICPAYATVFGLTVCLEGLAASQTALEPMLLVPRTIAYPKNAVRRLYKQDVAFCFQYHGGDVNKNKSKPPPRGWIVMTLFQIMGIMEHRIVTVAEHEAYSKYDDWAEYNDSDGQKERLDHIVVSSTSIGKAAVVFAHKVADTVSVPTVAFLLGPTLQRALSKLCPSMVCPNEKIDVITLPWPKLVQAMDFDPTGRTSAQPFWDQQVTATRMRHLRLSDALIQSLGKAPIVVDMKDMKHYVPLLSPDKVCGVKFSDARSLAEQGDWTAFSSAEGVTYEGTCIRSPYKAKLRKKIDELVATKGSCTTLARALNL